MSWLSGITGKAEDFLNKLDKSAAEAFHIEEESKAQAAISPLVSSRLEQLPTFSSSTSRTVAPSSHLSDPSSRFGTPPATPLTKSVGKTVSNAAKLAPAGGTVNASGSAAPSFKKKNSDEALFDFLNSKEPSEGNKKRVTPISSRHHSRQSSTSSTRGGGATKMPDAGEDPDEGVGGTGASVVTTMPVPSSAVTPSGADPAAGVPETQTSHGGSHRDSPTASNEWADVDALADAMTESPAVSDHSAPGSDVIDTRVSALTLENHLLNSEVESLNREMAAIIQRAKHAQTGKWHSRLVKQEIKG